ncbi:hypothetical protein AURDEDRAFT_140513 [Auricularia subglabra TFB-10046 SS5]|uniref:AA9 family lytic polysaccharide monooxygenase n=1 Tax=Auricularia subglabra (strain TFB-10046 / SS5) TaxID=717982 RepID=J0WRX5_AURST|nr:hypothetical protein AURDEDRAFT_140513 [Auricularia subglabra TFB-10046 SS5]
MLNNSLLALLPFAALASAHTIFQQLYVNGASPGHLVGIRYPTYDGPITDVTSNDVICNGGPNPLVTPYSQVVIPVPAGSTVTTEWHHTLDSAGTNDPADPVDASHNGPIMTYLAAVPNATQTSVTGLKWFKIYEDGLDSNGQWAVQRLIANKGKVSFKIPSCIANGHYFLRHELIALHAAQGYPGAQLYMECAQIQITGGGSASPATVSFPGAYKGSDPGITYNLYNGQKTYTIPGPRPFTCDGSGSDPGNPGQSTTSIPTTTTTVPSSTTSAPQATQTKYGQCGGTGWTGPTVCAAGSTCKDVSPPYYSQVC